MISFENIKLISLISSFTLSDKTAFRTLRFDRTFTTVECFGIYMLENNVDPETSSG